MDKTISWRLEDEAVVPILKELWHLPTQLGMGLGRIFVAQGRFGPISFGPAQGLGHFWNLTFGPGPGLDFLALGWAGPWARLKINVGPNLGHFDPKFRQM